jgi:hypothetical protein
MRQRQNLLLNFYALLIYNFVETVKQEYKKTLANALNCRDRVMFIDDKGCLYLSSTINIL